VRVGTRKGERRTGNRLPLSTELSLDKVTQGIDEFYEYYVYCTYTVKNTSIPDPNQTRKVLRHKVLDVRVSDF
jgi:hypothetical protein